MSDIYDVLEQETETVGNEVATNSIPEGRLSSEEYKQKKKEEKDAVYEMIDSTLLDIARSEDALKQYLDVQSKLDRYSVANTILIMKQMPKATQLKDFEGWKEAGASVKKGEKSIKILEPVEFVTPDGKSGVSYNVRKVLDISQTTARKPVMVKNVSDERSLLKALINRTPVPIKPIDEIQGGDLAYYDHEQQVIVVERDLQPQDFFRSLAKELSHAQIAKGNKAYTKEGSEFKAQCSAYMLCNKYGIDTKELSPIKMPAEFEAAESKEIRAELSAAKSAFSEINEHMKESFYKQRAEQYKDHER